MRLIKKVALVSFSAKSKILEKTTYLKNKDNNQVHFISAIIYNLQFQFYFLQQKKFLYRQFHKKKNTKTSKKKICKIIFHQLLSLKYFKPLSMTTKIGEKRKSQEVRDLYDNLYLVM